MYRLWICDCGAIVHEDVVDELRSRESEQFRLPVGIKPVRRQLGVCRRRWRYDSSVVGQSVPCWRSLPGSWSMRQDEP
eukprot:COSAG03_NODE_19839_length_329_cov_0.669565_1_plen_77_part_01